MPTLDPKVLIDVAKINKKPEQQTNKAYKKCKKANKGMFLAVFTAIIPDKIQHYTLF